MQKANINESLTETVDAGNLKEKQTVPEIFYKLDRFCGKRELVFQVKDPFSVH